jgi:hypothetical protein
MDTKEMYQRGAADAERGELHPFYYQHYYHYRRGYDHARRRVRGLAIEEAGRGRWVRLALSLVVLIVAGAGAFWLLRERSQPGVAALTPAVIATPRAISTAPVARTPLFPTITPSSPPQPLVLRIDGAALIANTEGRPLRGRQKPSLKSPPQVGFKEGERVRIREGPVEADGYIWWRVEGPSGVGWSAERSQEGVIWLQPVE